MAYFLLIIGVLLIIFALRTADADTVKPVESKLETINFSEILSSNTILQRLNMIEEKLDRLGGGVAYTGHIDTENKKENENIGPASAEDLNSKIFSMKDDGMSVEEISGRLDMLKGEVLLRLGMKR